MCEWGKTKPVLVTVPAELSHTGKERREVKQIDECIAPVVAALNVAGLTTINSCCGHGKNDCEILLNDGRKIIIRMKKHDTEHRDWPVCPYCGRMYRDAQMHHAADSGLAKCIAKPAAKRIFTRGT